MTAVALGVVGGLVCVALCVLLDPQWRQHHRERRRLRGLG